MKIVLLLLLISEVNLIGQTDSLEKSVLSNKLRSKEIDEIEFSKIGQQWIQKTKTDHYPDQPLDRDGKVHYIFVNDFQGFDKEYLFNRTLEWLAINYGILPDNLYSNMKDGKIIYNISLNLINNYSCIPTSIISIADEKIRIEFVNISYQAYFAANYDIGVPDRTVAIEVYPIILKKYKDWDVNFSILRETSGLFNSEVMKLNSYISKYEQFK